jgi:uncharacterized protein (TIGR02246 family)
MCRCARAFAALAVLLHLACTSTEAGDASTSAGDTAADASAAQEIARQSERHNAAWRLSNADSVAALYAPDGVVMFQDAPDVRGREAIRTLLAGMFDSTTVESLDVRPDTIEVYGSSAMEWGTYTESVKPRSSPAVRFEGRYVLQWQRQPDGQWAIRRFTGNTLSATAP